MFVVTERYAEHLPRDGQATVPAGRVGQAHPSLHLPASRRPGVTAQDG